MPNMHAVMKAWHPMLGRDLHVVWPPGSPVPVAPAPFFTYHVLLGWGFGSIAATHNTHGAAWCMKRNTDIGPLIPHIGPPSLLTPLDMIFSASVSYFASSRYKVEGEPAACALLFNFNPNLNCGSPFPFSVGVVIAITTHYVSMTWGDFLGGLLSFAIDFALQCALSWIIGKGAGAIANRIAPPLLSKQAAKALLRSQGVKNKVINVAARALVNQRRAAAERIARYFPVWIGVRDAVNPVVTQATETVVGFFTGGPLGADAGDLGLPTPGGALSDGAQDYLNDSGVRDLGGDAPPPANPPASSPPPSSPPPPRTPPTIGPAPPRCP